MRRNTKYQNDLADMLEEIVLAEYCEVPIGIGDKLAQAVMEMNQKRSEKGRAVAGVKRKEKSKARSAWLDGELKSGRMITVSHCQKVEGMPPIED